MYSRQQAFLSAVDEYKARKIEIKIWYCNGIFTFVAQAEQCLYACLGLLATKYSHVHVPVRVQFDSHAGSLEPVLVT